MYRSNYPHSSTQPQHHQPYQHHYPYQKQQEEQQQPHHHQHRHPHHQHPHHQHHQLQPPAPPPPPPPPQRRTVQQHQHSHVLRQDEEPHYFRHNQEVVMRSRCSTFTLTCAAMLAGTFTLVSLVVAVSTDYWLFMKEPYTMPDEELARWNLTAKDMPETSVMLHLRSGLWKVCSINLKAGNVSLPDICLSIDFEQDGTGRNMGAPICMTIVGAIRVAAPLPVLAMVMSIIGILMSALGSRKRNGKTIVASVFFILSGLSLAVGVLLFISAIYDELGYHSQTKGTSKDFSYTYGWSFYVAGSAFVSSEFSAVMCVSLYLRHNARVQDMVRIIPGLEDKLEEDLDQAEMENDRGVELQDSTYFNDIKM